MPNSLTASNLILGTGVLSSAGDALSINGYVVANPSVVKRVVGLTIDGGGSVISSGVKGAIRFPWNGTITKWSIAETTASPISGSVLIDVWKASHVSYPPTSAGKINTASIRLLSGITNEDATLAGWNTVVTGGNWFAFAVTGSPSLVQRVTAELEITLN